MPDWPRSVYPIDAGFLWGAHWEAEILINYLLFIWLIFF
jgi:hypothetical protein